eukprot:s3797_g3.t1
MPDAWSTSTRFLHAILKIGQSHCQVVVLYCRPTSGQGAVEYNNQLLEMALTQVNLCPLPFVILGDMNQPVESFQAWSLLESRGCRSLNQLHQRVYSTEMANTCMDATKPDNAILSPMLAQLVTAVQVHENTWFATHRPVTFDITMPGHTLFANHLRFPKSFVELGLDDSDWNEMTDVTHNMEHAHTIQQWGEALERNIDHFLQQRQGQPNRLSPAFRGRCQPVHFVKCPIHSPVKKARQGSFEPSTEVLSMSGRRMVKQVRRLESLHRRMQKLEREGQTKPNTVKELQTEWTTILRSHCAGEPFLQWVCSFPDFEYPTWPLPTAAWLYQTLQLTRHHTEILLQHDQQIQMRKTAYARHVDRSCNNKHAYAMVRGPGLPRVFEIGKTVAFDAMIVPEEVPTKVWVYADALDIVDLSCDFPISIQTHTAKIVELQDHCFLAELADAVDTWDEEVHILQHQFVISPVDVAKQLDSFWMPIWTRDAANMDFLDLEAHQTSFHSLLSQIPPHPQIAVDMQDPVAWTTAITKLKAASARGTDLISAQEIKMLPTCFIQHLARVLANYPDGFPGSFMHGLVCPLSKTEDIPRADQTRPITLLPQLYRVWAAVTTLQITKVLCTWIPPEVTGLLPGSGAASTAYFTQFLIEEARKAHKQMSGLTMDLTKCFNNIRWDFGFHALLALGIPKHLLVVWIKSLQTLTRHWLLSNAVITAGPGTCGFPEGDQYSVLVMVALCVIWSSHAKAVMPAAQHFLSAYADNWSWMSAVVETHLPVLRHTLEVTDAAGVQIDWSKTWFWTTQQSLATVIQSFVSQCAPGQSVQQKSSAADLGFQLQYSGQNARGIAITRLQRGFRRLERLQCMPHVLSVKESMLRTSVFPASLHGAEIKPPACDLMQSLRSKSAHALFGANTSMSPAVALACTSGSILDPEHWLIAKSLVTARAFLMQQSPQLQNSFFWICSRFCGTLAQVHGPAAALAWMLSNIDWKIDAEGNVHVNAFQKFSLLKHSKQRLMRFLQKAWMDKLVLMHTTRTKWYQYPDIARDETLAVLRKFPDSKRWMIIREISGAYQLASQKQKWITHSDGLCSFCQGEDSRVHRLVHCPVGSEVREPFVSLLHELLDEESLLLEYPVITQHPDAEAIELMLYQQAKPVWGEAILSTIRSMLDMHVELHWFTDGSCKHPCQHHTRHAAFAVVLDLCHSDEERVVLADQFRGLPDQVPSFQTACAARCVGEQDILRAELSAIVEVAESVGKGVLHVDSQSAITSALRALHASSPCEFKDCDHMDLLLRLWECRERVSLHITKVKAHQNPTAIADPLLRLLAVSCAYLRCPQVVEHRAHEDAQSLSVLVRGCTDLLFSDGDDASDWNARVTDSAALAVLGLLSSVQPLTASETLHSERASKSLHAAVERLLLQVELGEGTDSEEPKGVPEERLQRCFTGPCLLLLILLLRSETGWLKDSDISRIRPFVRTLARSKSCMGAQRLLLLRLAEELVIFQSVGGGSECHQVVLKQLLAEQRLWDLATQELRELGACQTLNEALARDVVMIDEMVISEDSDEELDLMSLQQQARKWRMAEGSRLPKFSSRCQVKTESSRDRHWRCRCGTHRDIRRPTVVLGHRQMRFGEFEVVATARVGRISRGFLAEPQGDAEQDTTMPTTHTI